MSNEDKADTPDDRLEEVLESLPELLEPRESGLRETLRSRIYHREVASEMGHLSWSGLWGVVLEYVGAILGFFFPSDQEPPHKGD